ncbi:TPA: tyrosine-type recombinase/integrase [Streptococcus agalactiae]|nr:tyrosine-type recombinase/integrase [Streptococcus agalactiae]HEO4177387.1 tyrosine-type recombinase/integrase [Streptococcus agalactiae]
MTIQITQKNIEELLARTPQFVTKYFRNYYATSSHAPKNFYRRLLEIEKFLTFYNTKYTHYSSITEMSVNDLEKLPITIIQSYILSLKVNTNSLRFTISSLSSFWNYFTIYSFTIKTGRPLFYRNAFNEWKVGYKETFETIKNGNNSRKPLKLYNQEELKKLLDFIDKSYVLTLTTDKKVANWQRDKERNIAIVALIIGAGLTSEELPYLSIRDIDMRKRVIKVKRNNKIVSLHILDFAVPYIVEYMKLRRKWWIADKKISSLFLTQKKERPSPTFFTTIIQKIGKGYNKDLSVSILRFSHGFVVYEQTKDISILKAEQTGNLGALEKYLI